MTEPTRLEQQNIDQPRSKIFDPELEMDRDCLWPGYILTQPKQALFWPEGEKI